MGKKLNPDPFLFGPAEFDAWWGLAACMDHPNADDWFADTATEKFKQERARNVCKICPVATKCLDYAMKNPDLDGMWGGVSAQERKSMRRGVTVRKVAPFPNIPLGTKFCHRGHDYALEGWLHTSGQVRCRECRRITQNERRERMRAAGTQRPDKKKKAA